MAVMNPTAPDAIGLEYPIAVESFTPLSSPTTVAAFTIVSTATESVTSMFVPHSYSGPSDGYGKLMADVYNIDDALSGTIQSDTAYAPSGDATSGSSNVYAPYPWSAVGVGTTYTKVDDGASYNDSDYLAFPNLSYARMRFGTGAWTGQVASVTFKVRAFGYYGTSPQMKVELYDATTRVSTLGTIAPPANGDDGALNFVTYTVGPFTTNPQTGAAWTAADIVSFSTGTDLLLHLSVSPSGGNVAVSWVSMVVTSSGVDKRVATGTAATQTTLPSGVQTTLPITFASAWSKTTGTTYLVVLRRLEDPAGAAATMTPQPVYLQGLACPTGQGTARTATIDASGVLTATGDAVATTVYPYSLNVAGVASVDSMPYWDIDAKAVYWDVPIAQQVNGASAQAYKLLRAVVGVNPTAALQPTQPLSFGVRRTSTTTRSEAWTGSDGAAWPAQWNAGSGTAGASATIQSNAGRMITGTAAAGYYRHFLNATVGPNFMATLKVTFTAVAAINSARVFFRGGSTWTSGNLNSCYELRLSANSNLISLYKIDGSGTAVLYDSRSFTFAAGTQYTIRIEALSQGQVGIKVWNGTEPQFFNYSFVDTTYTGTGFGLGVLGGADASSDTITYDDLATYDYLSVGDLTVADLAVPSIAARFGTYAFGTASKIVYNTLITMDAAATLASAVDYTIDAMSVVGPTQAWSVLWLDATGLTPTSPPTYGGSSLAASYGGGATTPAADFMLTFAAAPATPAGITVTNTTGSINGASIDYAAISWTSGGSLGAAFLRWEIDRSEDTGTTWTTIAYITTEATLAFSDYEGKRANANKYRVRAVRSDVAPSDYVTQSGTVTPAAPVGSKLIFVSNADAALSCAYAIQQKVAEYTFLSGSKKVFMELHDRDYFAVFTPLEQSGFQWPFSLQVHASRATSPTAGVGVRAFDTIRAIADDADVPYVCIHTPDGERFFGALQVGAAQRDGTAGLYTVDVVFTQTADDSSPVSI